MNNQISPAGQSKYFPGLDILKFALAVLIVAAHCAFLKEAPDLIYRFIGTLEGFAVPSFFAVSAFIFCSKIDNPGILGHTLRRIAIIFGVWFMLMLPLSYYGFLRHCNIKEFLYAAALSCSFEAYWFFKVLFINTLLLYICLKWKKCMFYIGLAAGIAVYLLCGYNKYYHYLPFAIYPYFSFYYHIGAFFIGALCYKLYERKVFSRLSLSALLLMLTLCVAANIAFQEQTMVLVQLIIPLVLIPLSLRLSCGNAERCKRLRALSILFYAMQFFFTWTYQITFSHIAPCFPALHSAMAISTVKFAFVMGSVSVLSYLVLKYEHRYEFLKYLH